MALLFSPWIWSCLSLLSLTVLWELWFNRYEISTYIFSLGDGTIIDSYTVQWSTYSHPKVCICTMFKIFDSYMFSSVIKGGSRHKNWCMVRALSFLIRYFSNYYTLLRSDLAARAAPLDPRLVIINISLQSLKYI